MHTSVGIASLDWRAIKATLDHVEHSQDISSEIDLAPEERLTLPPKDVSQG